MLSISVKYQALLKDLKLYDGEVDGKLGPKSKAALIKYQTMYGVPASGVVDAATAAVFDSQMANNPEVRGDQKPASKLPNSLYRKWPHESTAELTKFYGNVGDNQISIDLPYPMIIAWDTTKTVNRISCHKKVAGSLVRVFENIKKSYSAEDINKHGFNKFGGCLNVRKIRGGDRWSTHSWGIAIDLDPARNGLKASWKQSYFGRPECAAFVNCFKQEGWYSLGLERDHDAMHFQACWR
jgi:hypothetical protein